MTRCVLIDTSVLVDAAAYLSTAASAQREMTRVCAEVVYKMCARRTCVVSELSIWELERVIVKNIVNRDDKVEFGGDFLSFVRKLAQRYAEGVRGLAPSLQLVDFRQAHLEIAQEIRRRIAAAKFLLQRGGCRRDLDEILEMSSFDILLLAHATGEGCAFLTKDQKLVRARCAPLRELVTRQRVLRRFGKSISLQDIRGQISSSEFTIYLIQG